MAGTDERRRTLTSDSLITLAKNQQSCDLAGEMAIVNFDNGVYYGLDPTGARIWNLLREPSTIDKLCDVLAGVFDVDRSTLESDVRAFVGDLADQGLVEIA
jgi:coenzyme PQQ synthesis protein D (PqqD)